jgi:hypothetical protein
MVEATAGAVVQCYGTVANTPDSLRVLCRKLSRSGSSCVSVMKPGPAVTTCSANWPDWETAVMWWRRR